MNLNQKPARTNRSNQNVDTSSREYQQQLLNRSRGFFLTIIVFTVINLVLVVMNQGTQFLFSASVPYYLTLISKAMDNGGAAEWTVNGQNTIMALIVSAVILAVYLACWILSAKKHGWLTVGIVVFVLDTVALVAISFRLLESPMSNIVDLLVHVLIIWELSKGVTAAKNLKAMPENVVDAKGYKGTTPDLD